MSAANQLPTLMTVAEFLNWPTPDGSDRWELVDGVPVAMAPASDRHGTIHAQAVYLLAGHLADARPDCRVIVEPGTKPDDHNLRIPNLTVTCGPLDPAARFSISVLIVEILSPSNWQKTMRNVDSYVSIDGLVEVLGPVDKPRPDTDASEQDESHEAGGELMISGGDATLLLEMPNEALNP
jgi:Uma2 family endonuclease